MLLSAATDDVARRLAVVSTAALPATAPGDLALLAEALRAAADAAAVAGRRMAALGLPWRGEAARDVAHLVEVSEDLRAGLEHHADIFARSSHAAAARTMTSDQVAILQANLRSGGWLLERTRRLAGRVVELEALARRYHDEVFARLASMPDDGDDERPSLVGTVDDLAAHLDG